MKKECDVVAAKELLSFIENDGILYKQMYEPIIANLSRKKFKGAYNKKLALKAFRNLADKGARRYNWEVNRQRGIPLWLTPTERNYAAEKLLHHFEEEFKRGKYNFYKQKYILKREKSKKIRR
jgi:replication initiation and membrane attachment protein DnaB